MRRLVTLVVVLGALAAPALAHAAPPIARPNPALVGIRLDYDAALPAMLDPIDPPVLGAAAYDKGFLRFRYVDDLGGFMPAPVGAGLVAGGGLNNHWDIGRAKPAPATALDNGKLPIPGIGVPVPPPPPTPSNTVPPANQGFGGRPSGSTTTTTTTPTTTRRKPPPPPTTTTSTTTASTTTTSGTATGSVGTSPSGGGAGPASGSGPGS